MKRTRKEVLLFAVTLSFILAFAAPERLLAGRGFTNTFPLDKCTFTSTGRNPFFVLEPGFEAVLEGEEDGEFVHLVITVLDETKVIEGIETRVVKEKETHNGEAVEISKNFFAICKKNNSVFYFGEKTDIFENGQVVSHEGSWQHGVNGAAAGLVMPGLVLLGSRYQQEVALGVAEDRAEIIGVNLNFSAPAGNFQGCVKTRETTPLEPDAVEFKVYAPGVGLVRDDTLTLVSVTSP